MNERIKELACQAHGAANYGDLRFAELILQDCIKLVADAVDHREPASTYVDKIKQHFGMTHARIEQDWSTQEAALESLREHMARIKELEAQIERMKSEEPVGEVSGHDWSTGLLYRDLEPGTPLYTRPQPKQKEEALHQDNWQQYAKEGETAQDVIERERADCAALLELYKKLKQQL